MDVLPLPPRPSLDQYQKRAKALVVAARSADSATIGEWASQWLTSLARNLGAPITPFVQASIDRAIGSIEAGVRARLAESTDEAPFRLADAHFFLARAHGFANWAAFAAQVEAQSEPSRGSPFEAAADAVVAGDLVTLEDLLDSDPALIRARSTREHRATLLHYVAANGVEDFRQRTPPNAVTVARFLLARGAEVDALAETYGGGPDQTTLNLLVSSTHPAEAGLQSALVEVLIDEGAAVDGVERDGSPLLTALAFGYGPAAETLATRGARVDNVVTAAGVGRADLVAAYVRDGATLAPGVPLAAPAWYRMPNDPRKHLELALLWAAGFGRTEVVELLLNRGVDPAAKDVDAMTGLHRAAAGRHLGVIEALLRHQAPLEVRNRWGGTVLDSTVWFAVNQPVRPAGRDDYGPTVERLLQAGADVRAVDLPTGDPAIDAILWDPLESTCRHASLSIL